jgi:hypothetical protein
MAVKKHGSGSLPILKADAAGIDIGSRTAGQHDPVALARHRDPRCKSSEAELAASLHGDYRTDLLFTLRHRLPGMRGGVGRGAAGTAPTPLVQRWSGRAGAAELRHGREQRERASADESLALGGKLARR